MKHDYLWDKSGEPDPEIVRLERLLGGLRHDRLFRAERPQIYWLRYAAAVMLVMGAAWFAMRGPQTGWTVTNLQGAPKIGTAAIGKAGKLGVGEYLETDANAVARLDVGQIGEVTVDPNSRLRLLRSRENEHRIWLERGVIHAFIWAPPRKFFVDTPSAVAVDLGCKYTLQVDGSGSGLLKVETGWVAFEANGHESFIPAGAACETKRDAGPGVPYYLDASESFQRAVRSGNVATVLAEARPHDAMTLWHLLPRVPQPDRDLIYTRMASIAPPPASVTREGILKLDPAMMDQWWDSLGLESANWWRKWKGA